MSYYFRPPNSREQNLYIIRFSVDNLYSTNWNNNILLDASYTSPSKIFLPSNFTLSYNTDNSFFTMDYTNAKYEIPPSVTIQVKEGSTSDLPIGYNVSIINTTSTSTQFYLYYMTTTINEDNTLSSTATLPTLDILFQIGLQVQIIGRTITGPTFAIANQGWTYVESSNASSDTIYTSMNVGTNGVVPPFGLTIGGSYGYLGGGGNGTRSNTTLTNYSPTDVINNINNYNFFPIVLQTTSETMTLPLVSTSNIGQEIILLLNQKIGNNTLTITTANTNLSSNIVLSNEGDTVRFIALAKDGFPSRWVKLNNL
jgi:hypothetical protein